MTTKNLLPLNYVDLHTEHPTTPGRPNFSQQRYIKAGQSRLRRIEAE